MVRKLVILLLLSAGAALGGDAILGRGAAPGSGAGGGARSSVATVQRVVDGDTVVLRGGERVRYIGVDTPESVKPGSPVECFGKAAGRANARLVEGERVRLTFDAERRDRYGRTLAYVHRVSDGLFVNAELVRRGYASPMTIPPNVAHAREFRRLARAARRAGRGLWAACGGTG
jgi:micrococcal nuclease